MCDETCTVDCGKCKGGLTYRFEFQRYLFMEKPNEKVWFGPYANRRDAENAFQRAYGFWPTYTGNREVY